MKKKSIKRKTIAVKRKVNKRKLRKRKNPYRHISKITTDKPFYQVEIDDIPFTIDNRSGNIYVGSNLIATINMEYISPYNIIWIPFTKINEVQKKYINRLILRYNHFLFPTKMSLPDLK